MPAPLVHVVDDDPGVRGAISRLLRSCDLPVETYESAADFLARNSAAGPGCLVLDVSMSEMDGLQLQQLLTSANPSLAVVFVTGQAGVADSVRAMKAGAVDFLTKPFEDTQLLEAVRSALLNSTKLHQSAEQIEGCWKAFSSLTPRERQVCLHVARGLLNKQVGGVEQTAERYGGLVRFGVELETAPYDWVTLKERSGMSSRIAQGLYREGIEQGARPGEWRGTFEAVPRDKWIAVEVFHEGAWVSVPFRADAGQVQAEEG